MTKKTERILLETVATLTKEIGTVREKRTEEETSGTNDRAYSILQRKQAK